jgi:hypothetical protein
MPLVHFSLLILRWESLELFAWAGLKLILLLSACQVARITDMSHQSQWYLLLIDSEISVGWRDGGSAKWRKGRTVLYGFL